MNWEKTLRLFLQAFAVLLLTALAPVVMPFAWMQATHRWLGLGELPTGPIIGYLARSLSLLYAFHGALLLAISFDVRRYLPLIRVFAVLGIVFGVSVLSLDWTVGLPLSWILSEGPFIIPASVLVLWLAGRVATPRWSGD
ncbi:MAG: hypothetical protein NTY19_28700 [Planctomycetota bacterium]|nr:hypothetical protein [Planctomycetota bacterium]